MVSRIQKTSFSIYLSVFAHSLMYSIYFPIAVQLINDFELAQDRQSTGKWIGKISAFYYIGQALSTPLAFLMLSRFPLNRILVSALFLSSVLPFFLAASESYDSAVTVRFLQGLLCPIPLISNRLVVLNSGEFFDKSQSYLKSSSILGIAAGIFIGGEFERKSFLGKNPHLLASFTVFVIGMTSAFLAFRYLESKKRPPGGRTADFLASTVQVLKIPGFFYVAGLALFSSVGACILELSIVWMWTETKHGGFDMSLGNIWFILFLSVLLTFCYVSFYYDQVIQKIGHSQTVKESLMFLAISSFVLPVVGLSNLDYSKAYMMLVAGISLYYCAFSVLERSVLESVDQGDCQNDEVLITEVVESLGSAGKAFAVYLVCEKYSEYTNAENNYPYNYSLPFTILGFLIICGLINWKFVKKIEKPEKKGKKAGTEALLEGNSLNIEEKENELQLLTANK